MNTDPNQSKIVSESALKFPYHNVYEDILY